MDENREFDALAHDLREGLILHYNQEELQSLAFDLNVDWEELSGNTKSLKAQSLLLYLKRNGRLPDLLKLLPRQRPSVQWPIMISEGVKKHSAPLSLRQQSILSPSFAKAVEKYIERLQAQILGAFRHDHYVMLTVETLDSEDAATAFALQQALQSAFDIEAADMERGGPIYRLDEVVLQSRLISLLGSPGIGKTTSLRFLALQQIEAFQIHTVQELPVWISLSNWQNKKASAEEFLWTEFNRLFGDEELTREAFLFWLAQGELFLLLDGLDELPQRERQKVSLEPFQQNSQSRNKLDPRENDLFVLARECRSRFMLACRIFDYAHLPGWREFRILPMNDTQITRFVQRHLGDRSRLFESLLEQQSALEHLMQIPFFLRGLVQLVEEDWEQVPADRFQLVQYACQAALYRESHRRRLNTTLVMNAVGEVSYSLMVRGVIGSYFHISMSEKTSGSEEPENAEISLLEATKCAEGAGLLVPMEENIEEITYRYTHQLIQEALALLYLRSGELEESEDFDVEALIEIGEIYLQWGILREAQELLSRALQLCPLVGKASTRATILIKLSKLARANRRSREGLLHAKVAVEMLEEVGNNAQLAEAYFELGVVHEQLRELKAAEKCYRSAVEIQEHLDRRLDYAYMILYGLADLYASHFVYKIAKALNWQQKALNIFEEEQNPLGASHAKLEMALAYRLWGEMKAAEQLFEQCAQDFKELEKPWHHVRALDLRGVVLRDTGRLKEASRVFEEALVLAKELEDKGLEISILVYGLAWVASYQDQYHRALEFLDEALKLAGQQASPVYMRMVYNHGYGFVSWRARKFPEAAESWLTFVSLIDEEAALHLDRLEHLQMWWAQAIGKHTDVSLVARFISVVFWLFPFFWEKVGKPSSWLGRQIWRIQWRFFHR